ncbi:sensor histidine kinase [Polynucleobacter rarus]|uniref:sensor histidine kinase n=1 Tax=Polynucleobacter rarus TaxID=556055 RepID=UPI000D3E7961|nr:ATP-binding protein [Polynucleobacter rarus]
MKRLKTPITNQSFNGQYRIKRDLIAFIVVVVILAILLIGLLTGISADAQILGQYFVWLYTANIIIGVALLLLIIGLVVTLTIRWRQRYFGTRLIAKLAMIFGLVGVLPGAILYSVSLQFVGRSIESWFDLNVESALDAGLSLGRNSFEMGQRDFLNTGLTIIPRLSTDNFSEAQQNLLCKEFELLGIEILNEQGSQLLTKPCTSEALIENYAYVDALPFLKRDGKVALVDDFGGGKGVDNYRYIALYQLQNKKIIKLTKKIPIELAENAKIIQNAYSEYQEKSLSRVGLRKMYIGSLTLTMFIALFLAITLALILGRQLAQPLLLLLRGTQAVAQGDLSPKPEINSNDELGMLTRQFNNMTRQLRETRQSLQESKDFSESVLTNLTAGVCVFDQDFHLLVANEGAKRILERDLNHVIGKTMSSIPELLFFETNIKEAFKANLISIGGEDGLNSSTGTQPSWQRQLSLYDNTLDGDKTTPTLLTRGTELIGKQYIIVFDDITEVITAQRALAWGEVAQRLAHEIKNPLTPIQLSAERIYQKLAGTIPTEQEDIVAKLTNTIIHQVQAMKTMVNNFRDFGKKQTPNMQEIDLNQLINQIMGLYENNHIELKLDLDCPHIVGDSTQLRQVVHNILQNALDAATEIHSEPEIEIKTETVNHADHLGNIEKLVRLSVADNGPGFSPRILSRAFEPYITSKSKGTGLGLAVVKKIVDEHGARIELKNRMRKEVIRGARISILFQKLA